MSHTTHNDLQVYIEKFFPADLVFSLFTPPEPQGEFDKLIASSQSPEKLHLHASCRHYTFGEFTNLRVVNTAADLKRHYLEAKAPRYDVGAIYHGPVDDLLQTGVAARHVTIDIDVTDYKYFRDFICKCGSGNETKGKMCKDCIALVRVVAKSVEAILRQYLGCKRLAFFFTGGRGMHIYCLDYSVHFLTQQARIELNTVIKNAHEDPSLSQLCQPFLQFIDAYTNLPKEEKGLLADEKVVTQPSKLHPNWPKKEKGLLIDERVITQPGKLNRAPFSVNSATGRLCMPLGSPDDFQSVDCSPVASQLIRAPENSPVRTTFARGLAVMENITTIE